MARLGRALPCEVGVKGKMKNTKDRILAQGVDLLSENGFAQVTVGLLAQRTGMSKSGLFAHFGSKEEVQLGLMEETVRMSSTCFVEPAMQNAPGLGRLRALIYGWLGWTGKAGLSGGYPIAAGLFELDDVAESDPVRQRLLSMEEQWRELLIRITRETVETGELASHLDVDQFVWELCGIYLNHHVSERFLHDPAAMTRAQSAFEALVERSASKSKQKRRKARKSELVPLR